MLVEETCEGNFLWMQKHQNFAGTSFHEFIKKLRTRDNFFPEGFFINFVFFTSRVFRNIFKLFVLNAAFLYPLKHQKTLRFSDVFRGSRKGALGKNGLSSFSLPSCTSYCSYKTYLLLLFITSGLLVNSYTKIYQIMEKLLNCCLTLTLLKVFSVKKINSLDKIDQFLVKMR